MLGIKIGNPETRAALEKLTANQKSQAIAETEKAMNIEKARATASGEKIDLESKVWKAKESKFFKEKLMKIIGYGLVGFGANEALKVTTGIGF